MFKSFKLWVEEKRIQREVETDLLNRLGVEPDAALSDVKPERIMNALDTMGLPDEQVSQLKQWVLQNKDGSRIKDLINQIHVDATDMTDEQPPQGDPQGQPAVLPPGSPRPPQNPMQQSGMQNLAQNGPA